MKRLANWLCVIELMLFALVPLLTWSVSVLGGDVRNLVSEEALRWLFSHGSQMLASSHLALLILFLTAVGVMQESGLALHLRAWFIRYVVGRKAQPVPSHVRAFAMSTSLFLLLLLWLCWPAITRSDAFLSVSGTIFPTSPWLAAFPLVVCLDGIVASILYASSTGRVASVSHLAHLLSQGFERYGIWMWDVMLGGLLYHIIKYCLF